MTLGNYGVTELHPVAFLATLTACIFLIVAHRSQAILPLVLVACLIPLAQRVVVATLDFNMIRIVILFGWLRLFLRNEIRPLRLNGLDVAFLVWVAIGGLMQVIREGTVGAFVYVLGTSFDAVGVYLLFRMLLRHPADTMRSARYLAWVAALVAVGIAIEWSTGRNLFSVFGGVPHLTAIRDGRLRCQGAFSHPIMAGSFGATLFPIFVGMWLAAPRWRREALAGAVSAVLITAGSASSGPALSLVVGGAAWALWPARRHTRALRWGGLVAVLVVHFARERPFWHLIVRASDLIGGEGYHRYLLIQAFLDRWREWWLVGTSSTAHWGPLLWDTTNQYVDEGVTGGLLTLVVFVVMLGLSFRAVGIAGKAGRRLARVRRPPAQRFWCWGLGSALTATCAAFMAVSYFGQMQIILYLLLALVAAEFSFVDPARRVRASRRRREPRPALPVPV